MGYVYCMWHPSILCTYVTSYFYEARETSHATKSHCQLQVKRFKHILILLDIASYQSTFPCFQEKALIDAGTRATDWIGVLMWADPLVSFLTILKMQYGPLITVTPSPQHTHIHSTESRVQTGHHRLALNRLLFFNCEVIH